jgi:pyruvate/2-oxoglutarate dehydrogenase complex dihydrolipoamide dehydrogenase (E3) component
MATRPITRVGRTVARGETQGFLKILVDAQTKEILGASLLGIEWDEVIHSILDVMYAKAPYGHPARHAHSSYDHRNWFRRCSAISNRWSLPSRSKNVGYIN